MSHYGHASLASASVSWLVSAINLTKSSLIPLLILFLVVVAVVIIVVVCCHHR